MAQLFKNNAFSALAASLTNSATTLTVTTSHGDRFPIVAAPDFFLMTLQDSSNNIEIVRVTARTVGADSMTILRGQDGTAARAWNIGDIVELRLTAFALNPLALLAGASTAEQIMAILNPNGVYTVGDQTIAGSKRFTGNMAVGGSNTPATSFDLQTTGANVLTSVMTTGIDDLNFRLGAMNGVAGSSGTSQGKFGLFYLGVGEVATIDFLRGGGATDGAISFRTNGIQRALLDTQGNFSITGKFLGDGLAPTGSVLYVAMNTAPTGYLKANGAAVSRTTYAALFAAIGTTFGAGDGSTTFTLPDLRGQFIRGWDDGRGVDTGRVFGSAQGDAFKSHNHSLYMRSSGDVGTVGEPRAGAGSTTTTTTSIAILSTGSNETRPRNVALLACIKF